MGRFVALRAALMSLLLLVAFLFIWSMATKGSAPVAAMSPEYAKLMGATATQGKSAMPGPLDVARTLVGHLRHPAF